MSRQVNLGWIWVAFYTIAGAFALLRMLALFAIHLDYLFSFAAAGFVGGALVSRFSDGRSVRESLIASMLVAVGAMLITTLPHPAYYLHQGATYQQLLSSLVVICAASLGGSRLGAVWAQRLAYEGRTLMGAVLAAMVLVGAIASHMSLIALFEEVNHRLAVFLILLSMIITPSFAGAALQLSQAEPVERQVGLGLTLIATAFLVLIGWELRSAGTVFLLSIAFLGIGAIIYSVTLPGVLTVRSSRSWRHRDNELPVAVAVPAKEAR